MVRKSKWKGWREYAASLVDTNPTPEVELTPDEEEFWASFVNTFVISDEWYAAMTGLINFWREMDTDVYKMYSPLQELSDWELAAATELWIIYDFITTYVQWAVVDGIEPVLKPAARKFLAGYFVAMACKMDQGDIEGFIEVFKSQIKDFGSEAVKSEGAASRFN